MNKTRQQPLIGITCEAVARRADYSDYVLECDHRYAAAVKDAGGHPVLLPVAHRTAVRDRYLEGIDGLVIVGGDDLDPSHYGERPRPRTRPVFTRRTAFETWLYREGRKRRLPILGICYGMQLINVLEGGTLVQHLRPPRAGPRVDHAGRRAARHGVRLHPGTRLARILGMRHTLVASEHHQAVRDLAPGFVAAALAADRVVEAIESPAAEEILAVQWHPERSPASRATRRLFRSFVRQCARFRKRHAR